MLRELVADIGVERSGSKVKIRLYYAKPNETNSKVVLKKVIIEKYELPLEDRYMLQIREAIDLQQVMQHVGATTAYSSKVFHTGGSVLETEPYLIDVTPGIEAGLPYLIDEDSDANNYGYLYRVITYGENQFEYATRYVGGLINDTTFFNSKNPYINYLDRKDIEDILPEGNTRGIQKWVEHNCFFHETYKLRFFGEVEDFKFDSYWSRGFMNTYYVSVLMDRIEAKLLESERKMHEFRT
jgi:hypothetical protein